MKPNYLLPILFLPSLHAAELTPQPPHASDQFGFAVSLSGGTGIITARHDRDINSGIIYVFRDLDTATGDLPENAILSASETDGSDSFGARISLSGGAALIGAQNDDDVSVNSGAAYLFRDLEGGTPTAKLIASDGGRDDLFGRDVSLSGSIGLVSAWRDDDRATNAGAAYVFRNLDTATGSIHENAKLTASNGQLHDFFGNSVSLSGTIGLVGAYMNNAKGGDAGAAYVFRNLDTATGSVTENARLTASDAASQDLFGSSVSLSGTTGLVASSANDSGRGGVYVFHNLDTATGDITEDAKLITSDRAANIGFASSVSISGNSAIVGAPSGGADGHPSGSVYLYRNVDAATGSVTQNVKVTASDRAGTDQFGYALSLDGDNFLIGAHFKNSFAGKAYTGSVASLTTLDLGAASRTISGISFVSQDHWIIGQTTDGNTVTLSAGDTADVTAAGRAVHIGREAGSDGNALIIAGNLNATTVHIGSQAGNAGNFLRLTATASIDVGTIQLAAGNFLSIEGDRTTDLLTYLDDTALRVWTGAAWETVTPENQSTFLSASYGGGFTTFGVIPEPSALLLSAVGAVLLGRRRR